MNELPTLPGTDKVTTFLSRRQKAWGNFGSFIVLVILAVGFYAAAPFLITLLGMAITVVGKTIVLGVLVGLAAILWFLFSSKKFAAILWYLRAKFYRWFTSLMVKSNPLDIIYAYVNEYLGEKLHTIQTAADHVYGIRNEIKNNIENYRTQINERVKQADALKSRFYKGDQWTDDDKRFQFQKISSEAGMLQTNLNKSEKRFERTEKYCQIMKKMQQAFEFYRDKTKFFADTLSADYREAQAMAKATQATTSALGGDARVDIYEQSVKYVQGQISLFTGQVDRFMEVAPQFMSDSEIHNMVSEDAMMKTLDQWDQATDQLMEQAQNIGKAGQAISSGDTSQAVAIVIDRQKQFVPIHPNHGEANKKYKW